MHQPGCTRLGVGEGLKGHAMGVNTGSRYTDGSLEMYVFKTRVGQEQNINRSLLFSDLGRMVEQTHWTLGVWPKFQ
jgi:hypothetical protein